MFDGYCGMGPPRTEGARMGLAHADREFNFNLISPRKLSLALPCPVNCHIQYRSCHQTGEWRDLPKRHNAVLYQRFVGLAFSWNILGMT
jgi:hypothetical protein